MYNLVFEGLEKVRAQKKSYLGSLQISKRFIMPNINMKIRSNFCTVLTISIEKTKTENRWWNKISKENKTEKK